MRKTLIPLGLLAGGCLLLATHGRGGGPQQGPGGGGSDEQALRDAAAGLTQAFSKGDVAALASYWAPDAEYISEEGATTKGRDAIAAQFKKVIADLKGPKMTIKITSLRLLKGEVALMDGLSTITAGDGTVDDGRFTTVWVKADGRWMIRSARDLPGEGVDAAGTGGALKELAWMVGDWQKEKGGESVTIRWALDKAFLVQEYKVKEADGEMEVRQLVGYDPLTDRIKSWTFDSRGGYGEGLWTRQGNSWVADTVGVLPGGQTGGAVNVIRYVDDNTFVFQARDRQVGGEPIPDAEVKLVRKSAK
jgi:uncharacterized protein (TIGR02246 family)